MSIPKRLFDLLCTDILPRFNPGLQQPNGQPWWWPIDSGYHFNEWFDRSNNKNCRAKIFNTFTVSTQNQKNFQMQLMHSLQGRYNNSQPTKIAQANQQYYVSFKGFWGHAKTECGKRIIILSDQPSLNVYPSPRTTFFVKNLHALGLEDVHVTDFVKIRGPIGANAQVLNQATLQLWVDILIKECAILAEMNCGEPVELCIYSCNQRVYNWIQAVNLQHQLKQKRIPAIVYKGGRFLSAQVSAESIQESWRSPLDLCCRDIPDAIGG